MDALNVFLYKRIAPTGLKRIGNLVTAHGVYLLF